MRASTPKGKRTIVVDVKPEDWHKAEEQWLILKNTISSLNYTTLRDFQYNLWAQATSDPKAVVGEPVLVITDNGGTMFSSFPYPATILKSFEDQGNLYFRVIYHPIEEESWNGEKIEDVKLYQVMPLRQPVAATEKQKEDVQVSLLLTKLNASRNSEFNSAKNKRNSLLASIASVQKDLAKYEQDLKKTEQKLKGAEGDFITRDSLKDLLTELTHHRKVDWVMMANNGDLIVQTQMLYKIDRKTGEEHKRIPVGRFAMYINSVNGSIAAENLDYNVAGHGHMCLDGSHICLGDNATEVAKMITSGRFYDVIDFMIGFFSIFPHDNGSPYISSEEWLENRGSSRVHRSNPWNFSTYLYKVEQDASVANKKLRRKSEPVERSLIEKIFKKSLPDPKKVEEEAQKVNPEDAWEECEVCGERKPDVTDRECAYELDVNDNSHWETICDDCEHDHEDNI
jgi:hypothetical protein